MMKWRVLRWGIPDYSYFFLDIIFIAIFYSLFVCLFFIFKSYPSLFQLTEGDNELYKNFNITISERWQNEIAETIFEVYPINK